MPSPPTLSTVARLAGVSVASVSRVLNDLPATPEMERRVRDAAQQLGYVPDAAARSLRGRRTSQLALAVPDIGNPAYVAMMQALEATMNSAGYRLVLHSTGSDPSRSAEIIDNLRHRYVDGLIVTSIRVNDAYLRSLATAAAPVVVVGSLPEGFPVDNVRTDSALGVEMTVSHLCEGGRQSLGMLNGPADTLPGALRAEGFRRGLLANGLGTSAPIAYAPDFSHAAGREAAEALLGGHELDAVVCANDLMALAVMRCLSERGRKVPDEIAVAGMDDTELAALSTPSITSVSLESAKRGAVAARMMLERLADPTLPPRRQTVMPRLVVRESTAPVAAVPAAAAEKEVTPGR